METINHWQDGILYEITHEDGSSEFTRYSFKMPEKAYVEWQPSCDPCDEIKQEYPLHRFPIISIKRHPNFKESAIFGVNRIRGLHEYQYSKLIKILDELRITTDDVLEVKSRVMEKETFCNNNSHYSTEIVLKNGQVLT